MAPSAIAATLVVICVDGFAMRAALVQLINRRLLKNAYFVTLILSVFAAVYTTFFVEYNLDENTRVFGWPIMTVIFQRKSVNDPWLDFVGPTTILAYPMNVALFLFIPSIVVLVCSQTHAFRIKDKVRSG